MTAEAIPGAPSGSEASTQLNMSATTMAGRAGAKKTSKSPDKRLQTTDDAPRTAPSTEIPATGKPVDEKKGEAPQHAGHRLSSHLDMLAETVRAIVTRVMQPEAALAADLENDQVGNVEGLGEISSDDQRTIQEAEALEIAIARSEYSVETRQLCVDKHAAGQSYKAIAEELKMPVTTVQTIVKRTKQQGGAVATAARAGRPRVTNEEVEATIRELVAQNPGWTAREVLDQVLTCHVGIAVSFETIRRRVRDCKKKLNTDCVVDEGEHNGVCEDTGSPVDTSVDSHEVEDEREDDEAVETASADNAPATQPVVVGKGKGKARRKRGSEYSPQVRELCLVKHERDGKSYHAIAEELNIPPDSVRAIVRKAKKTGTVESAPRSGRPRKTTDLIDRVILQSVKNSERSTAKQIQDDLRTIYQVKVSVETIRRRVRDHTKQRLQLVDATAVQPSPSIKSGMIGDRLVDSGSRRGKRPPEAAGATAHESEGAATTGEQFKKRKRAEYSVETRERCVELHRQGLGYRKIGEQLDMPHTTVRAIVEKVLRTGSALPAPRSGRPRKTDEILDKVILQTVKMNSKCSARMIQQELESCFDVKVSCETIRRRVKDYMRQKHLFAEFVEASASVAQDDAAADVTGAEVVKTVTDFQLQQSMFGLASGDLQMQQHEQPFAPVPHSSTDDSSLPQSLMDMMTAAAAAAAVVSSQQQQQQSLALLPLTFMSNAHAFGLHSHSMLHDGVDGSVTTGISSQSSQPLPSTSLNDFVL